MKFAARPVSEAITAGYDGRRPRPNPTSAKAAAATSVCSESVTKVTGPILANTADRYGL